MYDLFKVSFPCRITTSRGGETFKPIGGRARALGAGLPILVDSKGSVLHVYPHRDSVEAAVDSETTAVWVLAALVPGVSEEVGTAAARAFLNYVKLLGWSSCEGVQIVE